MLETVLIAMGLLGVILASYLSGVQNEVRLVSRSVGRAQALYLAEAGLDAAVDLLAQDWAYADDDSHFPLREPVAVQRDGIDVPVGEFLVTVNPTETNRLRLTSVGRSFTGSGSGRSGAHAGIERTLSLVLVRREKPSFQRDGPFPGTLELEAVYWDQDGIPDLVEISGTLDPSQSSDGVGGTLSSGGSEASALGLHLFASFEDVDGDGDLDLVVSDTPSRGDEPPGPFIPSLSFSSEEANADPMSMTSVDLFGTGMPGPVVAHGWTFLPEGSRLAPGPGVDVFLNEPSYDGMRIVSWAEEPSRQPE